MKEVTISQRIHAVMKSIGRVSKEKKRGMQYAIVSHDAVTALARPLFIEHGIIHFPTNIQMRQDGNRCEMKFDQRFMNVDNSNDFIDVATSGYGVDTQDKGPGKAMSYGVKYAVLKVLQMETGEDSDLEQGHKAEHIKGDRTNEEWI